MCDRLMFIGRVLTVASFSGAPSSKHGFGMALSYALSRISLIASGNIAVAVIALGASLFTRSSSPTLFLDSVRVIFELRGTRLVRYQEVV